MQIVSIGYYFAQNQRFYLFTEMIQHLRCFMFVAVEAALDHIQVVIAASPTVKQ